MTRIVKNGLPILTVFTLTAIVPASSAQLVRNNGKGAVSQTKAALPVQQQLKPKSTPLPAVPGGRGTAQHKTTPRGTLPATDSKPGKPGHPAPGSNKPGSTETSAATKTSTPSKLSVKSPTTDSTATGAASGSSSSSSSSGGTTIINNNNNDNIRVNLGDFGPGNPLWTGWAAWTGPVTWGGFSWGGWGLPAYLPFALWSPIHEPVVFIP